MLFHSLALFDEYFRIANRQVIHCFDRTPTASNTHLSAFWEISKHDGNEWHFYCYFLYCIWQICWVLWKITATFELQQLLNVTNLMKHLPTNNINKKLLKLFTGVSVIRVSRTFFFFQKLFVSNQPLDLTVIINKSNRQFLKLSSKYCNITYVWFLCFVPEITDIL